jgi:hypothetical protein
MAKPNYSFVKRQKELERKRKQEEKQQRKQEKDAGDPPSQNDDTAES